jgi:hypothetical protein
MTQSPAPRFMLENREALMALIYSLGQFTALELVDQFRASRSGHSIAIDGSQTIGDLLSELVKRGILARSGGCYYTQSVYVSIAHTPSA